MYYIVVTKISTGKNSCEDQFIIFCKCTNETIFGHNGRAKKIQAVMHACSFPSKNSREERLDDIFVQGKDF